MSAIDIIPTVADASSIRGFGDIKPVKRRKYASMMLNELKHASRRLAREFHEGKHSSGRECEYVKNMIMLIQLARGVI